MANKPIFDGYEGLKETLDWVSEPIDIKERSDRLKDACQSSKAFKAFIWYSMVTPLNFKGTLNGQDLKIKPYTSDRYMCQPYVKTVLELERYSDSSNIPQVNRYNQLLNVLDFTWHEDAELLREMIVTGNHLPDKINLKVLFTAFPELGN